MWIRWNGKQYSRYASQELQTFDKHYFTMFRPLFYPKSSGAALLYTVCSYTMVYTHCLSIVILCTANWLHCLTYTVTNPTQQSPGSSFHQPIHTLSQIFGRSARFASLPNVYALIPEFPIEGSAKVWIEKGHLVPCEAPIWCHLSYI